ncbi:MAG: T9SS type A sorting domain-containing protein [Paludibacter sp.]|nr:T9SS type A sorting domain-containing protein [Paludibacter sp.]
MEIIRHIYKGILFSLMLVLATQLWAQEPEGYYSLAEGKNQAALKTALYNTIKNHTQLEYYSSSTYFRTTDWHPNGYFWDMYSNYKRTVWSGGGMNREHSMPKSWFGISSDEVNSEPIGSDLHNLYPSDANANSAKSNYALGEADGSSILPNTIVKVGPNTFPGYNGTVFEPIDEYKGDFARTYMYMVTCYENYAPIWQSLGTSSMLYTNTYPTFKPYAVNLLLKWNSQDMVSDKEIKRNNAVYSFQHNRNPYIDHPELAEFIWGNRMIESWSVGVGPAETKSTFTAKFNAATNLITVKLSKPEEATYFILSINGILLQTDKFSSNGTTSVADLKNGLYLIVVYTANKRKVGKFMIFR